MGAYRHTEGDTSPVSESGLGLHTHGYDILAFACLLCWMYSLYWGNLAPVQTDIGAQDFLNIRVLWQISEVITFLVVSLALGLRQARFGFAAIVVASGLMFAGSLVLLFFGGTAAHDTILVLVGVVLTGIGSAVLFVHSGMRLSFKGARYLLLAAAVALALASALDVALLVLPVDVRSVIIALLPAAYAGFTALAPARMVSQISSREQRASKRTNAFLFFRLCLLPALLGLAYGIMQRLSTVAADFSLVPIVSIAAIATSALLVGFSGLVMQRTSIVKLLCFFAVPLFGLAFILFALPGFSGESALFVAIIGFNAFYFMVWALWSDQNDDVLRARRFSIGLFVLNVGVLLGSVFGAYLLTIDHGSDEVIIAASLVVVYILLMASLLSFDKMKATPLSGTEPAGIDLPASIQVFDGDKAAEIISLYRLSAREGEVFRLLAQGDNRATISKELCISEDTTRTHMRNIYRKLDIHSQQELIDLYRGRM